MNLSIILEKYAPSNPIHFKQLHYFSDNLNEKDQVLFIEQIFKVGGYLVGSEIGSKSSFESSRKTAFKLLENKFDEWQEEIIEYLDRIPNPKLNFEKEAGDFILLFKSYSLFEFDNFLNKIEILGILISNKGAEHAFFKGKARIYFKNLVYKTLIFSKEITDDNYIIIFREFLLILMTKEKLIFTLSALKIPFFENIAFSTKKNKLPHDIENLLLDYSEKFINHKINKSNIYNNEFSEYLLIQLIIKKNSHDSFIKVSEKLINYLNSLLEKPIHSSLDFLINEIRFVFQLKRMGMQFDHETSTKIIIFLIEIFEYRIDKFVEESILEEYSEGYYKIDSLNKLLRYFRCSQNCFYILIKYLEKDDILKILYKIGSAIDHFSQLNEILKKDSHLNNFLNLDVYHFDENHIIRVDENGILFKLNFQPFSEGYIYKEEFKTSTTPKEIAIHPDVIRRHFTKIKSIKFSPIYLNERFFIQRYKLNLLFFGFENFVITQLFHLIRLTQFSPFSLRGNYIQKLISFAGKLPPEIRSNYVLKLKPIEIKAFIKERWPQLYLDIESYLNENSEKVYSKICAFHKNNTKVESTVIYQSNQGFIVSTNGLLGFLPGSQVFKNKNLTKILGNNYLCDIEKTDNIYQSFVVSNKSSIEEERNFVLSKIEKGLIVEGFVKNITDFGVFVDIGGIDGLIHISDLSWGRVNNPREIVELNQKVNVVILDFDHEKKRIALGFKQLLPDPWANIEGKYSVASKHNVKVRNLTNFGVFVELEKGVDGLIHISDLSRQKKYEHPSEFCKTGDDIQVLVLEIDHENRIISLGHKQLKENPWDIFKATFTDGSIHQGTIIKTKGLGLTGIVSLPFGFEGICPEQHMNKLDGSKAQVDETLAFKVLEYKKESMKIIVSHTRTFEEEENRPSSTVKPSETAKKSIAPKKVAASSSDQIVNQIKTTFGAFDVLSELKKKMEKGEENNGIDKQ